MKTLSQTYRFLNLVSVDVAGGAVVCGYFFAGLFHVEPVPAGLLSLGLTVWIIYSADHLMDAYSLGSEASTQRHRLHQRHFGLMTIFLIVASIVDVVLILHVRKPVLNWGLVLSALVILYLIVHRHISPFKELMVSALYACGVLLPAWALHVNALSLSLKLLVTAFALTALLNLLLFSWFEWEQDVIDGRRSIATTLGKKSTERLIWILHVLQSVILLSIFMEGALWRESLVLVLMNVVLLIIFLFPVSFRQRDLYRLFGDFIFFIPLVYIL